MQTGVSRVPAGPGVLCVGRVFLQEIVVGPVVATASVTDCLQLQFHFSELGLALEAAGVATLVPGEGRGEDRRLILDVQKDKVGPAYEQQDLTTFVKDYLDKLSKAEPPLIYSGFDLANLALFESELRMTGVDPSRCLALLSASVAQLQRIQSASTRL